MSAPAEFAYREALRAIGLDDRDAVRELVSTAVPSARLARTVLEYPNRPDSAPAAWLLAWPSPDIGLMAYVRAGVSEAQDKLAIAWPFARAGMVHDFEIYDIHHDPDCPELRMYEGLVGDVRLTVFDTFCEGCFSLIGVDDLLGARIHGWAVQIERIAPEPVILHGDAVPADLRAAFDDTFDTNETLTVHTDKLVTGSPTTTAPSPLYHFRSPVRAVREHVPFASLTAWTLTIALAGPANGDCDIDIELTVTDAVWTGRPPSIGDVVQGVAWLQAAFEFGDPE